MFTEIYCFRYLHIVEPWNVWPCIEDSAGTVVSLPPITNADNTKVIIQVFFVLFIYLQTYAHIYIWLYMPQE